MQEVVRMTWGEECGPWQRLNTEMHGLPRFDARRVSQDQQQISTEGVALDRQLPTQIDTCPSIPAMGVGGGPRA